MENLPSLDICDVSHLTAWHTGRSASWGFYGPLERRREWADPMVMEKQLRVKFRRQKKLEMAECPYWNIFQIFSFINNCSLFTLKPPLKLKKKKRKNMYTWSTDTGKNYFRHNLSSKFEGKLCEESLKTYSFLSAFYVKMYLPFFGLFSTKEQNWTFLDLRFPETRLKRRHKTIPTSAGKRRELDLLMGKVNTAAILNSCQFENKVCVRLTWGWKKILAHSLTV